MGLFSSILNKYTHKVNIKLANICQSHATSLPETHSSTLPPSRDKSFQIASRWSWSSNNILHEESSTPVCFPNVAPHIPQFTIQRTAHVILLTHVKFYAPNQHWASYQSHPQPCLFYFNSWSYWSPRMSSSATDAQVLRDKIRSLCEIKQGAYAISILSMLRNSLSKTVNIYPCSDVFQRLKRFL